jgi:thymidylate kinase
MHVIIFEGIATSGKSTLIELLKEKFLKSLNTEVFGEEWTHEPIMKDTHDPNVPFFKSLLGEINKNSDLVVFDRLYLTQAFRANINLDVYSEIEKELQTYSPLTVFLKVNEQTIAERVVKAAEHRRPSWGDYIKTKGNTPEEIANYYIQQQQSQLELLKQSSLPYEIFDTTNHEYKKIADEIIKTIGR